jgi:hypothetical protein
LSAQRDLEAMERAIHNATVPQTRHFQRHRREEPSTLAQLVILDGDTVLALVTLRDAVARLDNGAAAAARMEELLRASDFSALWSRREALLAGDLA